MNRPLLVLFLAIFLTALEWPMSTLSSEVAADGFVKTVGASVLIRKPARYFDLEGKTLRFTPMAGSGYRVEVMSSRFETVAGVEKRFAKVNVTADGSFQELFAADQFRPYFAGSSSTIDLPFDFPFSNRTWRRLFANTNGNISFITPESEIWPHRTAWSDGTMRSIAAAIDSRSAAGLELMIAALWAIYSPQDTKMVVTSTSSRVLITWTAFRPQPDTNYYTPLGPNVFQVALYPSGVIELSYQKVSERDGIVGVFPGTDAAAAIADAVDEPGDQREALVDIGSVAIIESGSIVLASITMGSDVPVSVADGQISYQLTLLIDAHQCSLTLSITASGRRAASSCRPPPQVFGYVVDGSILRIFVSKTLLNNRAQFAWNMTVVWRTPERTTSDVIAQRRVSIDESEFDLSSLSATVRGNVFEVFHYPSIPKSISEIMAFIYARYPPSDDIGVPYTDFRTDDLYATGPSSGALNVPISGIGLPVMGPGSGQRAFGSATLQVAVSPLFIGSPKFAESATIGERRLRNYSLAIRWLAHEIVHRWAAHLRIRNRQSGNVEDLLNHDEPCACHWSWWLHAPVAHPVWSRYSDSRYLEASVMNGDVWEDNGDGTFTRRGGSWPAATGLSQLDLYVMGLIPADQVTSTYILRNPVDLGNRRVRATKVPVQLEDVVLAEGPRIPSNAESQRTFKLGVYLLHEDHRAPLADHLQRAEAVSVGIADYFAVATNRAMQLIP